MARTTVDGCLCDATWAYLYGSVVYNIWDYCGNPDQDPGGIWCFTQRTCQGSNWGYCSPRVGASFSAATTDPGVLTISAQPAQEERGVLVYGRRRGIRVPLSVSVDVLAVDAHAPPGLAGGL